MRQTFPRSSHPRRSRGAFGRLVRVIFTRTSLILLPPDRNMKYPIKIGLQRHHVPLVSFCSSPCRPCAPKTDRAPSRAQARRYTGCHLEHFFLQEKELHNSQFFGGCVTAALLPLCSANSPNNQYQCRTYQKRKKENKTKGKTNAASVQRICWQYVAVWFCHSLLFCWPAFRK